MARGRISSAPATRPTGSSTSSRSCSPAVDVVRGPVANIYGSGAIGGVVSFRTKDVEDVLRPGERYGVLTHGMLGSNTQQMLGSAFGAVRFGRQRRHDDRRHRARALRLSRRRRQPRPQQRLRRQDRDRQAEFRVRRTVTRSSSAVLTYEANFRNGLPNATNTATVYATQAQNHIATGRWRYQRPEDRLFDFDGNVYWTETGVKQTKVAGINGSPSSGFLGRPAARSTSTPPASTSTTPRALTGGHSATL